MATTKPLTLPLITLATLLTTITQTHATPCRTTCGKIPISYPFGIDDGCGSPYYRHMLLCSDYNHLHLRTPSGLYPIHSITYSDPPHLLLTDPSMWTCSDGNNFRPSKPFSLDTSTHFTLSSQNDYLFFNCSPDKVIIQPKPIFCERFPERCDSSCDSSSYLCRHLPQCGSGSVSCCAYYPKAVESLRLMLKYCEAYTSVYWRSSGRINGGFEDQVAEYGIRVDFDIPVTTRCLQCQDMVNGGGTCGFDVVSQDFLCLCPKGNVTTFCKDHGQVSKHSKAGVIAGTVTGVSLGAAIGVGAGVWYLRKVRAKAPVTCGVQTNENRLF